MMAYRINLNPHQVPAAATAVRCLMDVALTAIQSGSRNNFVFKAIDGKVPALPLLIGC